MIFAPPHFPTSCSANIPRFSDHLGTTSEGIDLEEEEDDGRGSSCPAMPGDLRYGGVAGGEELRQEGGGAVDAVVVVA